MMRWILAIGVACLGLGMAAVYAGVITSGTFVPGTLLIAAGLVACGVAGVLAVLPSSRREGALRGRHQGEASQTGESFPNE